MAEISAPHMYGGLLALDIFIRKKGYTKKYIFDFMYFNARNLLFRFPRQYMSLDFSPKAKYNNEVMLEGLIFFN
jgi:hypothetical protein